MALRVGCRGPRSQVRAARKLRDASGGSWTLARRGQANRRDFGRALHNEQPTQNWSGQGESDCLIKTKHCDGRKRC